MSDKKDWVMWGLENAGKGAVAPIMAAVDFVTNNGEFSKEGTDYAFRAVMPDLDDIDDLLDD